MRLSRSQQRRCKRVKRKSFLAHLSEWYVNQSRATTKKLAAQYEKNRQVPVLKTKAQLINLMTNWQRNQLGKACKGMWEKVELEQAQKYATMPHWKVKANG